MEFKPPIKERETRDLIRIVKCPGDWIPEIVEQAKKELIKRKISDEFQEQEFRHWEQLEKKKQRLDRSRKGKEKYDMHDFIFDLDSTLLEMLFDWELKEKGYAKKHEFRIRFLSVLFIIIAIILFLSI